MSYNSPYSHYPAPPTLNDSNHASSSSSSSAPYSSYPAAPYYETPVATQYSGTSDAYSSFASPADPNARLSLLHADTHRAAFDASMAQQSSIYTPEASVKGGYKTNKGPGHGRTTVLRKGGGQVWEDQSLMEWDPSHFRLFIGDLDPALSDDLFLAAFNHPRYPSFVKAKIIREKHTNKGKGFGFVSYKDPEDFLKVWKEMNGKYVGTRPVKISKATTGVAAVSIGNRKAAMFDAKNKKKSGTEPFERAKAAELANGGDRGSGGFGPEKNRKSYIRR